MTASGLIERSMILLVTLKLGAAEMAEAVLKVMLINVIIKTRVNIGYL